MFTARVIGLLSLVGCVFYVPALSANTVDERVAKLEERVAALETKPRARVSGVYSASSRAKDYWGTDCASLRKRSNSVRYDFEFKVYKTFHCPDRGTFVVTAHTIPGGYEGQGTVSVIVFNVDDVALASSR